MLSARRGPTSLPDAPSPLATACGTDGGRQQAGAVAEDHLEEKGLL